MKIAINAHLLTSSKEGGVLNYGVNILKHLLQVDTVNDYLFISGGSIRHRLNIDEKQEHLLKLNLGSSLATTFAVSRFGFARAFKNLKCDLAFIPWVVPFSTTPSIVFVHDLVPLQTVDREVDRHHQRFLSRVNFTLFANRYAKNAAMLIANSLDTKKAILETCAVSSEKIKVIPLGIDPQFFYRRPDEEVEKVKHRYHLSRPYFINMASGWHPRKNLGRLIEAFAQFAEKNAEIDLVITGKSGPSFAEMQERIAKHGLQDRVHLLEFVAIEDLPALLTGALSLVFPSLHEGFGLPVLEAMGCGCPAIISSAGALPEVGGDAGLYIDPYAIDSIASAMHTVADSATIRKEMAHKSLQRVQLFTWEKAAEQTLAAFHEATR